MIYGSPHQVSLEGNVVAFTGATGANEIRVPDNLADGLSIEGTHGDFITFTIVDFCTNEIVEHDSIDASTMTLADVQTWIMDGDAAAHRIANGGAIIYGGRDATCS
jgi:hypothetical protein